jgi:hypothetical protein
MVRWNAGTEHVKTWRLLLISISFLVPEAAFNYKQLPDLKNSLSFRGSQPC